MKALRLLTRLETKAQFEEGLVIFRRTCLPRMALTPQARAKVMDYLEKLWLTPNWVRAWTDYGRFELGLDFWLTTNNHIERYWQEIQRLAGGRILKRPDELLEMLCGIGLRGLSPRPSVLQAAALHARDHEARAFRPRIATDVAQRRLLAQLIILAPEAISRLAPGIFAVKAGVAPAAILQVGGGERQRAVEEHQLDAHGKHVLEPLMEKLLAPTVKSLTEAGSLRAWREAEARRYYVVDLRRPGRFCSCPDHGQRGSTRDRCKHITAVECFEQPAAVQTAEREVTAWLAKRCVGEPAELLEVMKARIEAAATPTPQLSRWEQLREAVARLPLPAVMLQPDGAVAGVRRGPEVAELKARHQWRQDKMRPRGLDGPRFRGRGALRQQVSDASKIGHKGGTLSKARRREAKAKKARAAAQQRKRAAPSAAPSAPLVQRMSAWGKRVSEFGNFLF
eukprot:COSAG01_NODE_1548_length_9950_cov_29.480865_6_plen_452_part_00